MFPSAAVAQAGQAVQDSAGFCFTGRPLPRCKTFLLTEAGQYWFLKGTEFTQQRDTHTFELADLDAHLSWEIGVMSNLNPNSAAGGTVLIGVDGNGGRFALKGRYRRWLGEKGMLDMSAGALRASLRAPHNELNATGYGITGDVALGWRDWAALTVRADALSSGDRTVGGVYGGVRLGSQPAIIATTVFVALIAAFIASYGAGT